MWGSPVSYRIFEQQFSGPDSRQAEVRRMVAESLLERSPQFVAMQAKIAPGLGGAPAMSQTPGAFPAAAAPLL